MAKAPPFARFVYLLSTLKKDNPDLEFEGCDEILAYMAVKDADSQPVKITDLVQSLQFGTGPTVHRKVSVLAERALIKIVKSRDDGRAKNLSLTASGLDFLKERSRLMKQCLEG